nr:MAG TPA: hypothetical protein [Caudoviricetes sp.]
MAKWTDYTTDTNPTDTDEVMTLDADESPKANKRVTLSTLADYFLDKLASKVFAKLETQDKTVIGALNELNSKPFATYLNLDFREYTDVVTALNANRNLFLAKNGYIVSANTKGGNPFLIIMAVDENRYGNCFCIGYDGRYLALRVTPTSFEAIKGWN